MKRLLLSFIIAILMLSACSRPYSTAEPYMPVVPTFDPSQNTAGGEVMPVVPTAGSMNSAGLPTAGPDAGLNSVPTLTPFQPVTREPDAAAPSPTPDPPKPLPTIRTQEEKYTIQARDTLFSIALKFGVDIQSLMEANNIQNANLVYVGQVLVVPAPSVKNPGTSFKVIPDSELVYSPRTAGFSVAAFAASQHGYLANYHETVDDMDYTGASVVERIAREYSVNPRLLLAVLEYQSSWVTKSNPPDNRKDYPMGRTETYRKGLYRQLAWAADNLNRGFYLWRVNGVSSWLLTDGSLVPVSPELNAGTAGIQQLFSQLYDRAAWDKAVSDQGLYALYNRFFGNPFDYALEPLLPANLTQPPMQLPFENGKVWSFTGGPHGGWGEGSAWAALDFAPPSEGGGCLTSYEWVVAVADGVIVRSELGEVVQDLDGDGDERTGWSVLYMHIGSNDRVKVGTVLHAGDRIGHPSCEGGVSNGTHTHIARRYNGEWIPADGPLPFNLDGWISAGEGVEYYGNLKRDGQTLEAWDTKTDTNQIAR